MGFAFSPVNPVGSLQMIGICSISLLASTNAIDALAKPACLVENEAVAMTSMTARNSAESRLACRQSTNSILNFVDEMAQQKNEMPTVKVPSRDYAGILHELKNNRAVIVEVGSNIPAGARIVLKSSLSQRHLEM